MWKIIVGILIVSIICIGIFIYTVNLVGLKDAIRSWFIAIVLALLVVFGVFLFFDGISSF